MAKPNYSFEKRQRELAKKKKKEGKLAERAARKAGDGPDEAGGPGDEADPSGVRGPADALAEDRSAPSGAAPLAPPAAG